MRSQSSESVEITEAERRTSNAALGPVPWCSINERTADALRRAIHRHYGRRQEALRSLAGLMGVDEGGIINLDFVNRYASYFYIDDPCLCDQLPGRGQVLGAGRVGCVSSVEVNRVPMVIKCINNVNLQKYLSLRVTPYTEAAKSAVRAMNGSNDVNVFRNVDNDQPVHLHVNGDTFSNQTCMHLILNLLLGDRPNYVYQYDSFYCDKDGVVKGCNIMERAQLGDLSSYLDRQERVNFDVVNDIVSQVLPTLFALKTPYLGFVHADLKCRNVFVSRAPDGRPEFKIADYDKSSIYFRGVRFHNTFPFTWTLPYNSFPVEETLEGDTYYRLSSTATYLASFAVSPGAYIQLQTMYNPYGFYMSYDVYTFLFSLLMEPAVWPYYFGMYRQESRRDNNWFGWNALWFPDDLDSVMAYIETQQDLYQDMVEKGDDEGATRQLVRMRSLRAMNDAFALLGWKFKTNVMRAYYYLTGSNIVPSVSAAYLTVPLQKNIKVSNNNHVCVKQCESGWCNTNRYKQRGMWGTTYVYDWDNCSRQ